MTPFGTISIDFQKLLQGRYEADRLPADFSPERIVPDYGFNVLNPLGLLYTPIVDQGYLNNGGKKPIWPNGKAFAVCLTHDVDSVSLHSLEETRRMRWGQIKGNRSVLKKIENILGLGLDWHRYGGEKDPLHCYELWLRVEAEFNVRSTFFFWPGISRITRFHYSDCRYDLSDMVLFDSQKGTVSEMIREIDHRSWDVGLHPSWFSFDDVDEMKRQKETVEEVLGHEVISVRQHYLHYDVRTTPRIHYQAGFKYDSTLGFNDNVGFRFGTCYPWHLYDLNSEKETPVLEIPLIVQDCALLSPAKGLRLDEEMAFMYVVQIAEAVEQVGGVLTLLWHPHSIVEAAWWNLYLRTLQYLKKKDAWFGTVKEVGESWEGMRRESLLHELRRQDVLTRS